MLFLNFFALTLTLTFSLAGTIIEFEDNLILSTIYRLHYWESAIQSTSLRLSPQSSLQHWLHLKYTEALRLSLQHWCCIIIITSLREPHWAWNIELYHWDYFLRLLCLLIPLRYLACEFLFHGSPIPSFLFRKYACHACNKYHNDQNICWSALAQLQLKPNSNQFELG